MNIKYYSNMTTIENIEEFLNLEVGERRLRRGRKDPEKNQYYYFENQYYIVQLTKGLWMIAEDCRKTRELLRKHCWCAGVVNYAMTKNDNATNIGINYF